GDLPAVPGGQKIVGASTDHVEAERAAVLAAVDGIPARQQRPECTAHVLDPDGPGVGAGALLDGGHLRGRDGAVSGHHYSVGGAVDVPRDASDPRLLDRVAGRGKLAFAA